ncbi:MAG: hypothetical protein COC12_00190 [Rhodobacteraceae bacterium]|nr:MAG: hypothetical protein COC12_00190 [Paracoccaceae bacterium]
MTIAPQKELNASALANSLNPRRGRNSDPKQSEKAFGEKAKWAAGTDADLGIISAEFFSAVNPQALVKALEEHLPDYTETTRIIAYVRPHFQRVLSGYAQQVKAGAFSGGIRKFLNLELSSRTFLYTPRFTRWQQAFGDRFILRPLVREELQNQDVTADFFNLALRGVPFSLGQTEVANETLTLEEIAGMRVVQSVLKKRKVASFLRLSVGGAIGRDLAQISGRSGNKLALNSTQAAKVLAYYRADAMALDAQFFDGTPMEQALVGAAGMAAHTVPLVSASAYFQPETIEQLQRLSVKLAKLLKGKPHAWRRSYQLRIGQAHEGDFDPPDKAHRENAAAAWDILGRVEQILVTGRASAGVPPKG